MYVQQIQTHYLIFAVKSLDPKIEKNLDKGITDILNKMVSKLKELAPQEAQGADWAAIINTALHHLLGPFIRDFVKNNDLYIQWKENLEGLTNIIVPLIVANQAWRKLPKETKELLTKDLKEFVLKILKKMKAKSRIN